MKKVLYLTQEEVGEMIVAALDKQGYEGDAEVTLLVSHGGQLVTLVEGLELADDGEVREGGIEWTTSEMAETPIETRPRCEAHPRATAPPPEKPSKEQKAVDELDFQLILDRVEKFLFRRGGEGNAEELADHVSDLLHDDGHLDLDGREPTRRAIKALTPRVQAALEDLREAGKAEEVEVEGDLYWQAVRKRRAPKSTPASTAADILGGEGGVLDRGDALGQGVSEDGKRPASKRRKRRRR